VFNRVAGDEQGVQATKLLNDLEDTLRALTGDTFIWIARKLATAERTS
jgi:hypothetical protein